MRLSRGADAGGRGGGRAGVDAASADLPAHLRAPRRLHHLFERTARLVPDRVAIDVPPSGDRPRTQITYADLDTRADALARRLAPLVDAGPPEPIFALLLPRRSHHLYAAQLAVLKAGGAYTCLDPAFPAERIRFVLEDAGAVAVLTDAEHAPSLRGLLAPARVIDVPAVETAPPADRPPAPRDEPGPEALCYVIYTSGTTGRPKGVMIEHRSIVNLVLSDAEYFDVGPSDRVGQSSSAAYDSSIEETYLAFATGATLVVLDDDVVRMGPDLVPWLRAERVTVLCPPPTLLRATGCADPAAELPDLRLLYVGGEALTPDVADRWAPGRWLENGYGPTECTVTVTRTRVREGVPITIGRPVRGNRALVLDEALRAVAPGEPGELCIAGAGVARGYLNRPELTAAKFVDHPEHGRLYRTGDLVRRLPSGDLEYLGRIDAQVKIRGHRVELEEIESVLAGCPGVQAAACAVQGAGAAQRLVAFVVPAPGTAPDFDALRAALAERLPAYMVPARFGLLDALPVRPSSGKLDRDALARLPLGDAGPRAAAAPRTEDEALVLRAFEEALELPGGVGLHDDFFDLGGDSLAAAETISALRAHPRTAALTVRDLYESPTVAGLAARLEDGDDEPAPAAVVPPIERPRGRPGLATAIQATWLALELLVGAQLFYWIGFRLFPWVLETLGLVPTVLLTPVFALAATAAWVPLSLGAAVAAKRALIGRYRPGAYPLWGSFHVRHWLLQHFVRLIPWRLVAGTELQNVFLRALGARIGRRVHLHGGVNLTGGGWDLLEIGDDATLGQEAALRLVDFHDGMMVVGPVIVGAGATLETRAGMAPHSTLGRDAYLTSLSMVPSHTVVPDGERWDGVPAAPAGAAPAPPPCPAPRWSPLAHAFLMIGARFLVGLASALPTFALALAAIFHWRLDADAVLGWLYAPASDLFTLGAVVALVIAGLVGGLATDALLVRALGRVRPGTYSRWSGTFVRLWLKSSLVDAAGNWLSGTLFWPHWLRWAGMRVGPGCEISTIIDVVPELVEIGAGCFFADGIYLGGPRLHRGTVTCGRTTFGDDTFLGNHAVIPPGARLPGGILLGVCTVADEARIRPGTSWFGHPAFELPRREVVECDRSLTHDPPWARYVSRLFWEASRFLLPVLPTLLLLAAFKTLLSWQPAQSAAAFYLLTVPGYVAALAAIPCAVVVALKWGLLGRVRPGQHPLWSCWCSRWDFLYVAWGAYARGPLSALEGTLLLAWWLRAMGVRVGRRVYLGAGFAQVVDPDMLHFEDEATVTCLFQAHSFEDRVLKIAPVHIRRGASPRAGAVLLYGADIGARTTVAEHSVVMKHERLLPDRYYAGCPTRPGRPPPRPALAPEPAAADAPRGTPGTAPARSGV